MGCCTEQQSQQNIEITNSLVQNMQMAFTWSQVWIQGTQTVSIDYYQIPATFSTDPADVGDEILQREQALCLAVRGFLNEVMNYMESWMISNVEDILVAGGGALMGVVAIPGLLMWPVLFGWAAGVAVAGNAFLELRRSAYREYLFCRMFENLKGLNPDSRTDFESALDADPIGRPQPEDAFQNVARDAIETYIRSQLNNLDNYLMFAGQLGTAMDLARDGGIDCPCTGEWEHSFLGGFGQGVLTILDWPVGQDPADYDPVGDLIDGQCLGFPNSGLFAVMQLAFPSTVITRVRLHVNYVSTRASPTDEIIIWDGVMDVGAKLAEIGVSGTDNVILDTGAISITTALLQFEVVVAISNTVCPDDSGGVSETINITLNGQGTDPF